MSMTIDFISLLPLVFFAYYAGTHDARKRLEIDLLKGKTVHIGQSVIMVNAVRK